MNKEDVKELLDRYSKGLCSQEERKQIERYILKNPIVGDWQWKDEKHREFAAEKIRSGLYMLQDQRSLRSRRMLWGRYAVAAAVVLILGFLFLPFDNTRTIESGTVIAEAKSYTHDEVTITLPNGEIQTLNRKVTMDDLNALLRQNGGDKTERIWLTIQVPSRKHQEVLLADGSSVWLNAGSTLRFPTVFPADQRTVYLQGEGYFNIAHNRAKPFIVDAGEGQIEVTGTKFNVQAFADNNLIRTSLVEGGVNFYMHDEEHRLTPGIELIADTKKGSTIRQKFDVNQITSWRDGYFVFDNLELMEVMKLVSRWYNVTTVAEAELGNKRIGGSFPTELPLEELLQDLTTLSGAKFEIQGKEVRIVR